MHKNLAHSSDKAETEQVHYISLQKCLICKICSNPFLIKLVYAIYYLSCIY